MEDREEKIGSEPETEAHRRNKPASKATEEAPQEGAIGDAEDGDDVELHRSKKSMK